MFNKILPLILSRAKSIWLSATSQYILPKKTVEFTLYINDEMARDLQMNDINTTLTMTDEIDLSLDYTEPQFTLSMCDELPISLEL